MEKHFSSARCMVCLKHHIYTHDPTHNLPSVYDLPAELLSTLEPKLNTSSVSLIESNSLPPISQDDPRPASPSQDGPAKATSCALCNLSFPTVAEQRSHVRSDLHSYNLKQKLRGHKPVAEVDFERLMGDLDESLSGSESSESSDSDADTRTKPDMLASLLKRQANLADADDFDKSFTSRKRKRNTGRSPLLTFTSSILPKNTQLAVWRALFTPEEQARLLADPADSVPLLHKKQLTPKPPPQKPQDDLSDNEAGGVPLPQPVDVGPHIFLCMIGGGHFAAMVVGLSPKRTRRQGAPEERQATVLAHKTFHRYTTRRKQGGSQAANDSAKGAAHSAGSSLRRYNEEALVKEVRDLLTEWRALIASSELLFIRATGSTNRRTLFGPYEGQILRQNDERNRGFPFSTRRATQAELMRCFVELTRVKVSTVDEEALALARAKEEEEQAKTATEKAEKDEKARQAREAKKQKSAEEEEGFLHTSQIEALVRRQKAPAIVSYLASNQLPPDFELQPPDSAAHHHAPFPLHLAASSNAPAIVSALLTRAGADPTKLNGDGRPAYDLAGDRATRDAFRLARSSLQSTWDWDAAHVPEPLTKAEVDERARREKDDADAEESARRQEELARLDAETRKRQEAQGKAKDDRREKKHGKGQVLQTAEEAREQESRGLTPEMRMRLERERRARAMEMRMRGGA